MIKRIPTAQQELERARAKQLSQIQEAVSFDPKVISTIDLHNVN